MTKFVKDIPTADGKTRRSEVETTHPATQVELLSSGYRKVEGKTAPARPTPAPTPVASAPAAPKPAAPKDEPNSARGQSTK